MRRLFCFYFFAVSCYNNNGCWLHQFKAPFLNLSRPKTIVLKPWNLEDRPTTPKQYSNFPKISNNALRKYLKLVTSCDTTTLGALILVYSKKLISLWAQTDNICNNMKNVFTYSFVFFLIRFWFSIHCFAHIFSLLFLRCLRWQWF